MLHSMKVVRRDAGAPDGSPAELIHCDLLHHARRRWRMRLPNCKLQTLERFVCRRLRRDDIAGSQIPQEYHQFVRTGDARQLCSILQHNALDLLDTGGIGAADRGMNHE